MSGFLRIPEDYFGFLMIPEELLRIPEEFLRIPEEFLRIPYDVLRIPYEFRRTPKEALKIFMGIPKFQNVKFGLTVHKKQQNSCGMIGMSRMLLAFLKYFKA